MTRSNWPRVIFGAVAVLSLATAGQAQTTHVVELSGIDFSPAALTITVGDTVQWNWVSGFHSVESGVDGVPAGVFTSGNPTSSPQTFSVTFDQAFIDANPLPGNVYPYYCVIHVGDGMSGTIAVQSPAPALPPWGMALLVLLLLGTGVFVMRHRMRVARRVDLSRLPLALKTNQRRRGWTIAPSKGTLLHST